MTGLDRLLPFVGGNAPLRGPPCGCRDDWFGGTCEATDTSDSAGDTALV